MTANTLSPTQPSPARVRPTPRAVIVSAWAVPVMVAGGFAMLAIVPLGIATAGVWRNPGLRRLRPWAAALSTSYAAALLLWAIGPDRPGSLTKDLHPVHAVVICALGVALAVAFHLNRRRSHP
ncbi:hypothetical protein LWF15_24650 [Kineosporia rhizophila]|uniref:hypothetical protein n=1 Tax=Kineosporia TaxID=49184 RepID=UPI001E36514F|nr:MULTISPECIES: hypothetical protein [Kineosporia]MCE0538692.1 hypothetical protein [Kineosporia rhizophila]GLY19470.1 hypothetical protein Kisp01_64840 [Kineosporia sp. NBRC 101677]